MSADTCLTLGSWKRRRAPGSLPVRTVIASALLSPGHGERCRTVRAEAHTHHLSSDAPPPGCRISRLRRRLSTFFLLRGFARHILRVTGRFVQPRGARLALQQPRRPPKIRHGQQPTYYPSYPGPRVTRRNHATKARLKSESARSSKASPTCPL